jgi:transcriptional regulator
MYRPAAYAIDDAEVLQAVMRERSFATIAAVLEGRLQFAYAPVVIDREPRPLGQVRFHLARGNPLAQLDHDELWLSFLGPDAYVSPDWYVTRGLVPTWNYIAVEVAGRARVLEAGELRELLVDLSARHEEKLRPKRPWTLEKIPEERVAALVGAIRGFAVPLETLTGKFKLSQDKTPENVAGVIAGLESCNDATSLAVARAIRRARSPGNLPGLDSDVVAGGVAEGF